MSLSFRQHPPTKRSFRDIFWDKTNRCSVCVCVSLTLKVFFCLGFFFSPHKSHIISPDNSWHCLPEIGIQMFSLQISAHQDPFMRSMAYWVLEDYSRALDTLLEQPANVASSGSTESTSHSGGFTQKYKRLCVQSCNLG